MRTRKFRDWSTLLIYPSVAAVTFVFGTGGDWRSIPDGREDDKKLREGREEAEPDYCRTDSRWQESRKKSGGGSSVVAGTGGDETRDPIFFNHVLDKRIFCGEEIQGLDDTYHDGEALEGNTGEASEDIRIKLGYSLYFDRIDETVAYEDETTDDLSDDRRAFFQVFLRHQCFDQTSFNAAKHYHTYDWCRRRTSPDEMPSRSKVKKLLEEHFPDKSFVHKNFLFVYDRGETMRKKVVEAFEKFEGNVPIVKAIYREAPKQGRKRHAELRKKYKDIYKTLDPITEAFENGEDPPEGCGKKLEKFQNELAGTLGVEPNNEAVKEFRGNHPTGRQLTEALAYCYSRNPHVEARFNYENELLEEAGTWKALGSGVSGDQLATLQAKYMQAKGPPPGREAILEWARKNGKLGGGEVKPARITELQHIVHARQEVYDSEKSEADLPKFLDGQALVPDLERKWLAERRSKIEYQPEDDRARRKVTAAYGEKWEPKIDEASIPVVDSITDVPVGKQLAFPSKTIEREKADKCVNWKNTGKIDSIYWHGGEKKVDYKRVCTKTVDRGMYEKELGVEPVVVADWEAEMLEEGMRVFVRSNSADPNDAVLVDAWHPDKDKPVVLQGVRVNQ